MDNPYSPPESESVVSRRVTLYSPGHIAWATFLGAPIAGCLLMALNYRRLGHSSSANFALIGGLVTTVLLLAIAFVLPDNFPSLVLPLACTFGMYQCVNNLQGTAYERRLASGGRKGSGWVATGVGILSMVFLFIALFAVLLLLPEEWLGEDWQ
jgi:hypothetical protein